MAEDDSKWTCISKNDKELLDRSIDFIFDYLGKQIKSIENKKKDLGKRGIPVSMHGTKSEKAIKDRMELYMELHKDVNDIPLCESLV